MAKTILPKSAIPRGWRIVKRGRIHKGDKLYTIRGTNCAFEKADEFQCCMHVDLYICIIRKA